MLQGVHWSPLPKQENLVIRQINLECIITLKYLVLFRKKDPIEIFNLHFLINSQYPALIFIPQIKKEQLLGDKYLIHNNYFSISSISLYNTCKASWLHSSIDLKIRIIKLILYRASFKLVNVYLFRVDILILILTGKFEELPIFLVRILVILIVIIIIIIVSIIPDKQAFITL